MAWYSASVPWAGCSNHASGRESFDMCCNNVQNRHVPESNIWFFENYGGKYLSPVALEIFELIDHPTILALMAFFTKFALEV